MFYISSSELIHLIAELCTLLPTSAYFPCPPVYYFLSYYIQKLTEMNETNKKTETTKSLEENTAERPYNL